LTSACVYGCSGSAKISAVIELGVATERAGFDGYFLWDHIVFSNSGDGPPIVDPWLVLSMVRDHIVLRNGTVGAPLVFRPGFVGAVGA
jgi:hypothetical protein